MANRRTYSDQLPKYQPWTIERIVTVAGGAAGIVALGVTFFKFDHLNEDIQTKIFIGELTLFAFGLIVYIYVTTRKKLHRYAQCVFFSHYVNHCIRDEIASMEAGQRVELRELMQDIVDATANCFSLLTAKRCRACIVELDAYQNVNVVVRDRITSTQSANTASHIHKLADNTDFSSIFSGRNGCPRYFLSQNLMALWRKGKYQSSSFQVYGIPETMSVPGLPFIAFMTNWTLPYKSTIVWPIRHIPDNCKWPLMDDRALAAMPPKDRPFVWGLPLCGL
jgi:hypothetical protein